MEKGCELSVRFWHFTETNNGCQQAYSALRDLRLMLEINCRKLLSLWSVAFHPYTPSPSFSFFMYSSSFEVIAAGFHLVQTKRKLRLELTTFHCYYPTDSTKLNENHTIPSVLVPRHIMCYFVFVYYSRHLITRIFRGNRKVRVVGRSRYRG